MGKYDEKISDNSVWITATPTELAKTLPFCIKETGHFTAEKDYIVSRRSHDSFLMIYTIRGQGSLYTNYTELQLHPHEAVIIDCHYPHKYFSISDEWEFLWIHFNGTSAAAIFNIIYPNNAVRTVLINSPQEFEWRVKELISKAGGNSITEYSDISLRLHSVINTICAETLERITNLKAPNSDIRLVLDFIDCNYSKQITIEDMIRGIHISKYHFIRLFRRIMGITPYQYLTNYRINMSKTLLRSTDKTVSEIAESCGFLDTSNFITHFKKHTGQRPLGYRRDFS